ncbi:MAG: hypothetical protein K6F99_07705 [Lachnospiraceae bacterium]|nr:hypothetical protein [Lachnospiraceae bacterium]
MKINSNITAYLTNNALRNNETAFALSTNRLSSGFKINKAGDDPTGYAITGRMRAQLDALDKCDINGTTGVSMIETAEGAMSEIQSMVQRLNELAVKAANGTLSENDRGLIQDEVAQLTEEIERIGETTELNNQHLLNGNFEDTGYCNDSAYVYVDKYSSETGAGDYNITITQAAAQPNSTNTGYTQELTIAGFPDSTDSQSITLEFPQYIDPEKGDAVGWAGGITTGLYESGDGMTSVKIAADGSQYITVRGENREELTLKIDASRFTVNNLVAEIPSEKNDGKTYQTKIPVYELDSKINGQSLEYTLNGKGAMALQIGAREQEKINVTIPQISLDRMDIDGLDLTTEASATHAIDRINNALAYVSKSRSSLGAYQNRIESNLSYIGSSSENLTTAYSRIKDTDMAEEMTKYANLQVLTQASTSMLAQANQAPQQALQLLQ